MLRLDPPIPIVTPRGKGFAHVLVDYSMDHDFCWLVCQDDTNEWWTWRNQDVRGQENATFGRRAGRGIGNA